MKLLPWQGRDPDYSQLPCLETKTKPMLGWDTSSCIQVSEASVMLLVVQVLLVLYPFLKLNNLLLHKTIIPCQSDWQHNWKHDLLSCSNKWLSIFPQSAQGPVLRLQFQYCYIWQANIHLKLKKQQKAFFLFLVIVPAFHVAKQYIQRTLTINKPNLLRIKIHLGLHYVFLIMPEAL